MAIWRLHLVARETMGQDENGWPLSRFVNLSTDIEENSVFRLREEARALVHRQVKMPTAIVGMERMDKKTGKNYEDWFHDIPEDLPIVLDEGQQRTLEELKDRIWAKALAEVEALPYRNSLLIDSSDSVKFLTDKVACFYNFLSPQEPAAARILSHEEAAKHIAALQKFYSSITPVELQILCLPKNYLSCSDLDVLRSYNWRAGG